MMKNLLLIFFLYSTSAFPETVNVKLQQRSPEVLKKYGQPHGPIIDLIDALLKDSGLVPSYSWMPWSRALMSAKNKESMLLVRHSMLNERRKFLHPIPYGQEIRRVYFFKNKKTKVHVEKFEDLYNYSIGFRNKSFYSHRFNTDIKLHKVPLKRDQQLVNLLQRKRVDLVVFNSKAQFIEMTKTVGINFEDNFEAVNFKDKFPNGRYFSIPIGSEIEKYYDKLNCSMYKLRQSGAVGRIFKKYGLLKLEQSFEDEDSKKQMNSCKKSAQK